MHGDTTMICYRMLYYVFPLLLLSLVLSACEIQGGAPPPTTPGALATAVLPTRTPTPTATTAPDRPPVAAPTSPRVPTPTVETRGSALRIGLLFEPADVLPYHSDAGDERITAPISELLFPAPILTLDYSYTATHVLERLPSFANGDIELRQTEVYLDESGAITTTETDVLTDAQQIAITYHWNPQLRWSDGVTVTAADSVFAYELAQQTDLGEEAEKHIRLLEDYIKLDDYTTLALLKPDLAEINTVVTRTDEPDFNNAEYLLTVWTPLPRHVLEDETFERLAESDFAMQPISYGPYVLERREQGVLRLRRNPFYAPPLPEADVVSFVFAEGVEELQAALLNGSLDVAVTDQIDREHLDELDRAEEQGSLAITYLPGPIWEHLDFNLTFGFLRQQGVRQAIAYGTNRQAMADRLFAGRVPVLDSWIVPEHWAAAPPDQLTRYPYDPDKARGLLDEAHVIDIDGDGIREQGIDHDSDGVFESGATITLTLLTTEDTPLRAQIAEQFQSDMDAIGLAVTVKTTDTQQLFNPDGLLFQRQFELVQFAWISSADPRGFELWSCSGIPSQLNNWTGSNLPGWCSRDANQAIISATTQLDWSLRRDAYVRHQQLFSQELPVLPLFQRLTVVMNRPNLRGLRPDPIAPVTWNIAEWSQE